MSKDKPDNKAIEEKIYATIDRSFLGTGYELIAVLNMKWRRLTPGTDTLEYGLGFIDQSSHICFIFECIVFYETVLLNFIDAFLYRESTLLEDEDGQRAHPEGYASIYERELDLTAELPDSIVQAISGAIMTGTIVMRLLPSSFAEKIRAYSCRQ